MSESEENSVIEEAAEEEIDKEELSSANEVIQGIIKSVKAFRMYLPNSPLLQKFFGELKDNLSLHLENYGDLRLDIDQFTFKYKGKTVHSNDNTKESLPFKVYSDGIRVLVLSEGIEERELHDLLDIIGKEGPVDLDDDIVTQLWQRDLPHIAYIVLDEDMEADASDLGARSEPNTPQQGGISNAYKEMPPEDEPPPAPPSIPKKILTLTEDEIAWIKSAREAERKKNPIDEVFHIISAILVAEKDEKMFIEFTEITVNLIKDLINTGEAEKAIALTKFLNKLSNNEKFPEAQRVIITKYKNSIYSEEVLNNLGKIVDETEKIAPKTLNELIILIGESAIGPFCKLLASTEKREMREVIIDGLIKVGRRSHGKFIPFLEDDRWFFVRNIILILRKLGDSNALHKIGALASHEDIRIRKEVFNYLHLNPDAETNKYMVSFLNDEDNSLRINALKNLSKSKYQDALQAIIQIAESKEIDEREMPERRAIFEALGEIGAEKMLPMLREMIMKKYMLNKVKEKEAVICAVAGIRKIKSNASLELLKEASAHKKGDIKDVITQAIKALSGGEA